MDYKASAKEMFSIFSSQIDVEIEHKADNHKFGIWHVSMSTEDVDEVYKLIPHEYKGHLIVKEKCCLFTVKKDTPILQSLVHENAKDGFYIKYFMDGDEIKCNIIEPNTA